MPLFIGNSEVEKVFIGETEVQTVRTEGDLRFNAFTNTPPQVSLSANAASYNANATATFTATVIDPDVPGLQTLTYVWTDNGTVVRTTTGTSSLTDAYTVSYSSGTRTIGVTVTDSGSGVSNNVTIARSWLVARTCSIGSNQNATWTGGGSATVGISLSTYPYYTQNGGNILGRLIINSPAFDQNTGNTVFPATTAGVSTTISSSPAVWVDGDAYGPTTGYIYVSVPASSTHTSCYAQAGI